MTLNSVNSRVLRVLVKENEECKLIITFKNRYQDMCLVSDHTKSLTGEHETIS